MWYIAVMSYHDNVENIHEFLCKEKSLNDVSIAKKLNEIFKLYIPPKVLSPNEFKKLKTPSLFSGYRKESFKQHFLSPEIRTKAWNGEAESYWFTDEKARAKQFSKNGLFHVVKTLPEFKVLDIDFLYGIYKSAGLGYTAKPLDSFTKKEKNVKNFICNQKFQRCPYLTLLFDGDATQDFPIGTAPSALVYQIFRRKNLATTKDTNDITYLQ
jgi:hypothetical protein